LAGVNHRREPPGLPLGGAFLLEARQPLGVLGYGTDVFLKDEVLGGRGPEDLAEPPQGRGAPGGPACIAEILPQAKRFKAQLCGLEVVEGILPHPAQSANRFIGHFGSVTRGEIPRAHQAGQCEGVASGGFHPLPGFLGHPRGRAAPAALACFCQRAGEPSATRAGCIDPDEVLTVGGERTDELRPGTWTGAHSPDRDDLRMGFFSDRGHGAGLCVDRPSDLERGRLGHGGPPRACCGMRRRWLLGSAPAVPRRSAYPDGSHYV
jgi:hypothetical protein